jgi:hypothetical protein
VVLTRRLAAEFGDLAPTDRPLPRRPTEIERSELVNELTREVKFLVLPDVYGR